MAEELDDVIVYKTHKWHSDERRGNPDLDLNEEIGSRLEASCNPSERQALFSLLAGEHHLHRRDGDAERVIRAHIAEFPDSPRAHIELATHYLFYVIEADGALLAIDDAIAATQQVGQYYREALGNRARIGIKFKRHDLLRDSIEKIIDYGWREGQWDIGLERDFIDNAPSGSIPPDLVNRYNQFYSNVKTRNSRE